MSPEEKEKHRLQTLNWQRNNRERMREINKVSYKKNGRSRSASYYTRHSRIKHACTNDDLIQFVTEEAHDLRIRRNKLTGIEWHVDHIIPLNGATVSGLHVWNNLQVIPAQLNYAKRNRVVEEMTKFLL